MAATDGNSLGMIGKARESVYFKNLNSLRFIAVFMVFVHHVEQLKAIYQAPMHALGYKQIPAVGTLGVRLFFVLSGFLITYLLFAEQEVSGTINVRKFYIRRALRIWPLYYLIILLSLFVFPQLHALYPAGFKGYTAADMPATLVPYVFFLSNIVLYTYGIVMFASHTWSIGTEEQFYFVWPLLFRRFRNKFVLLSSIVVLYIVIKHVFAHLPAGKTADLLIFYWSEFPIDNMAIGGLFALVIYSRAAIFMRVKRVIFNPWVQAAAYVAVVCSVVFCIYIPDVVFEYYCMLFGIIIANLAANDKSIVSLETPVLKYLGKISYGLYIYHPLMIVVMLRVFQYLGWQSNALYYPLALLATVLVAGLSYELFEVKFIQRKKAYSVVVSGDNSAAA